jgi:hypothetical protein
MTPDTELAEILEAIGLRIRTDDGTLRLFRGIVCQFEKWATLDESDDSLAFVLLRAWSCRENDGALLRLLKQPSEKWFCALFDNAGTSSPTGLDDSPTAAVVAALRSWWKAAGPATIQPGPEP